MAAGTRCGRGVGVAAVRQWVVKASRYCPRLGRLDPT
jgi:hypothetical protein